MTARRLVLLRHGESEWNAKNLFTGWIDVGLSEHGATQAVAAGQALADGALAGSGGAAIAGHDQRPGDEEADLLVGVLQSVQKHVIEHSAMAHPVSSPGAIEQIGRIGHALHAACDHNVGAACR